MRNSLNRKLTFIFSGIVLVACLLLLGTCSWIFRSVESTVKNIRYDDILSGYKTEVKAEVETALSIVQHYYGLSQSGKITEDQAKSDAEEALRDFRYGDDGSGYVWIDDTDYTLVMHPILPDQEGANRKGLEDKNGVMIIQEIMKVADKGGYNEFMFTKSDGKTVAPKIAYSKAFPQWNWVITTGCYTDDIKGNIAGSHNNIRINKLFKGSTIFMIVESIVIVFAMVIISTLVIKKVTKEINRIKDRLGMVADGDLSVSLDQIKRTDELGQMLSHTNLAIGKFKDVIKKSLFTSKDVEKTGKEVKTIASSVADASDQISTAIEGIAGEATNQASAINTVTSAVKEMQENTDNISSSIQQIGRSSDSLLKNSGEMKKHISVMQCSSGDMTDQINDIAKKIAETSDTIEQMSGIVNSIENIASQTNLLALNASIEAARAGEAGKGFAVVADSIKGLSEDTSSELANIKAIINDLVDKFGLCTENIGYVVESNASNMEDTKEVMDAFDVLDKGITETSDIALRINSIIKRSVEQITSISNQIVDIQRGAESSAAASEEVTASVEELTALMNTLDSNSEELTQKADNLVNELEYFKVD
ncbi:MAG: methyl-accepting chemotaxis protein [Lachnospiraceae bacterium]|nr:methyl-accepting chemotaxis protein [Lachnospiraceae bacterium]